MPTYLSESKALRSISTMASQPFSSSTLLISFAFLPLLISPVYSKTCKDQNLTSTTVYSNCSDLPTLDAYLHWTYNASNSSLSFAFTASPAKPGGWVAWGINPTGEGMIGAQAFIAFKSKGSVVVKTYNISSTVEESNLSFDVWDISGEESNNSITIYASAKVPKDATKVNQTWQVGPSVSNGMPAKHASKPENDNSKGHLVLVGTQSVSSSETPSTSEPSEAPKSSSETSATNSTNEKSGSTRIGENIGLGFYLVLVMSLLSLAALRM